MSIKEEVTTTVTNIVTNYLKISGVDNDTQVFVSGILDPDEVRNLVMELEEVLNVNITDEEADKLVTVGDIINLIVSKKENEQ